MEAVGHSFQKTYHDLWSTDATIQRHQNSGNLKVSVTDGPTYILTGIGPRDSYASIKHAKFYFNGSVLTQWPIEIRTKNHGDTVDEIGDIKSNVGLFFDNFPCCIWTKLHPGVKPTV